MVVTARTTGVLRGDLRRRQAGSCRGVHDDGGLTR